MLEQFATSSGTSRLAKYWRREWSMEVLSQPRSLRTLPPSMAARGVKSWILSRVEAPVRISALPGSGPESAASAVASSGSTSASSKKPSRRSSSGKTWGEPCQVSLFSTDPTYWDTSTQFAPPRKIRRAGVGTLKITSNAYTGDFSRFTESAPCCMSAAAWERWVTNLRQDFSRRQKLAQAINENGFSCWPTSRAEDSESAGNHPGAVDSLTGATRNWPTPRTVQPSTMNQSATGGPPQNLNISALNWQTPHGMNGQDHTGKQGRGGEFAAQAKQWTTPQAHDTAAGDPNRVRRFGTEHGGANLTDDVKLWATPNCPNGGRVMKQKDVEAKGATESGKRQVELASQATIWGTPTSRDWKDGSSADTAPTNGLLGRQVIQEFALRAAEQDGLPIPGPRAKPDGDARDATVPANWPTPDANAMNDGESRESWQKRAHRLKLEKKNGNGAGMPLAIACLTDMPDSQPLRQDRQTEGGRTSSGVIPNSLQPAQRKKLNVFFVTWMMNWPWWWTIPVPMPSASAEMEWWLSRQATLLESLLGGQESRDNKRG